MSDKLYPIKNGDVTLYVQMSCNGTQFDFKGFTVKGDGNFYMPSVSDFNRINLDGRPCVDIGDFLFEKYKALADAQLREYLERHIHDALSPQDFESFWHEAGQPLSFKHSKTLREKRVIDGLVGIEINNTVCVYNFAALEPAGYKALYRDEELATTPMRVFYGDHLARLLALEQHERGMAPPAYAELARLDAFLEGKKSVKLVMKDGSVHELKPHYGGDVSLHALLHYEPLNDTPFWFNNSHDLKPRFERCAPLAGLAYLQHGKQQFVIDVDALGRFERKEAVES
jgi:hypothetical protein